MRRAVGAGWRGLACTRTAAPCPAVSAPPTSGLHPDALPRGLSRASCGGAPHGRPASIGSARRRRRGGRDWGGCPDRAAMPRGERPDQAPAVSMCVLSVCERSWPVWRPRCRAQDASAVVAVGHQTRSAVSFADSADFSYDPPGRNHLFVPGPVNIADRVQRAMAVPPLNHRDAWFPPWLKQLQADTRVIYNTDQEAGSSKITPFIFPGSGTGGWESALQNTLSPGDKIVTFTYGMFSKLWVDMMRAFDLNVTVIECPWGEGANEEKLGEFLKANKDTKAVAVVHNETATGVTSDLQRIRETMDSAGSDALLLVDGVSSIGALPFKMDAWGVDVAVTGSQKALSLPTGLALLAVSEKAREARKSAKLNRMYFDWGWQQSTNDSGNTPYTPCLQLLFGLRESLNMLMNEGISNVVKRHHRLAEGTRKAVDAWGLKLLCQTPRWRSDSLSVISVPESIDSADVVTYAYAKHNLTLGVGLGQVAGKVFRIGHLGNCDSVMMLGALGGAEMALRDAGYTNFTPGKGVGAAVEYWQQTADVIKSREITV